jgi:hypothetical protein
VKTTVVADGTMVFDGGTGVGVGVSVGVGTLGVTTVEEHAAGNTASAPSKHGHNSENALLIESFHG